MPNGISGVGQGVVIPQDTQIRGDTPTQQTGITAQVEQNLGGQPTTPLAANTTAQQTIAAVPLTALRGTDQIGVAVAPARLAAAQNMARAGLAAQIGITVPPGSSPAMLDSRMIAKEIQSLPKGQRSDAMANAGKTLQQRVNNGFKVYQNIENGTAPTPASERDIRDFMTFLTARASQKTASFSEGAFNLPDPGSKIRDFLDSSTEVYQRTSTHIEGFSDHQGCGHRGIDLKLPHGKGTLLYGAMKDGVMGTRGDRLFLKMESHGCRISTLSQDKVDTQGPQSRPKRFFADLLSSIKHGWGGLKTLLGLQNTEGTRKERLDKGVERDFKALVETTRASGRNDLLNILNENNPAGTRTGQGVRTMMANINRVLETEYPTLLETGIMRLEVSTLPPDLKAQLTSFEGELDAKYDNIEHRIGNEVVFNEDELDGTGNAKEQNRAGQARSLVSQLMEIKNPAGLTEDTIKGLLTTAYALGSTIDGEGKDDRVIQKSDSLDWATTGLNPQQKDHLREIMTSDKMQDLINELLDRSSGMRLDMPGLKLTNQQELNVRGLMSDAAESLMYMTKETGVEPRMDLEYTQSQVTGLSDAIFDITESLAEPMIQEQIHGHISSVDIEDRSALGLQALAGDGNMVVGTSARAMFPDGPPIVDQISINARARTEVEDILANPRPLAKRGLAKEVGISDEFMRDFNRGGVVVNGTKLGATGSNVSQETIDQEVEKFVDALGGREQAVTASKLLFQVTDSIPLTSYPLGAADQATQDALFMAPANASSQVNSTGGPVLSGLSHSITVNDDGSAVISCKDNKGDTDQVRYSAEVGIRLSGLTGDVRVDDVQVAMIFTSND
ncbi:MAG: hypothetical protein RBR67_07300 [Desulfobacterium sp.]|jgi:hypothetical protein|nr:hypothetical protein [Desulfobacterium sp.]